MNIYDLSKHITNTIAIAKQKSLDKDFYITPETTEKVITISQIFSDSTSYFEKSVSLDTAFNALDITVKCYVFEVNSQNLQILTNNTDLICIDAENDGKLCIQMKLLNAATIV